MKVELVDVMGTDLTVVNAARVSLKKHHSQFTDDDARLLRYLAEHHHWTPFAHPQICLRVEAPIFVARQLAKHHVGMVWSEVSRRYVDDDVVFLAPNEWRCRAQHIKQGSGESIDDAVTQKAAACYHAAIDGCREAYKSLLNLGIAPEQARMVLPQSLFTEWVWTGSLCAFFRVWKLRGDSAAQTEARAVGGLIRDVIQPLFPIAWQALEDAR